MGSLCDFGGKDKKTWPRFPNMRSKGHLVNEDICGNFQWFQVQDLHAFYLGHRMTTNYIAIHVIFWLTKMSPLLKRRHLPESHDLLTLSGLFVNFSLIFIYTHSEVSDDLLHRKLW